VVLRGKTVVAVTHDLNLASQMHRRIHVVDGRLANDEVVTAAADSLTFATRAGAPRFLDSDQRRRPG